MEIVVAGTDVVVTPVPAAEGAAGSIGKTVSSLPSPTPMEETPKETDGPAEVKATPKATTIPTASPTMTPTPMPTITPTPSPIPTATPKPTATPNPTAAPTPVLTPIPTPDTEKLMQQELDDVYTEYTEEWDKLYKEYESKCALVMESLNYMGPPTDDPEYIAEVERLNGLLDTYEAEFKAKVTAMEASYYAQYQGIYEKYGR